MEDYIIDDILKILSDDTIYIPKSVAQRSDVYDVSKTLFGVIFTDCVDDLRAYGSSIGGETVGKMMKAYVMDMTYSIYSANVCVHRQWLRLQGVKLSCSSTRLIFRNVCGKVR